MVQLPVCNLLGCRSGVLEQEGMVFCAHAALDVPTVEEHCSLTRHTEQAHSFFSTIPPILQCVLCNRVEQDD
uniref:Uncharacterized protein n=1 Tax=Anguilla anguilla TaxID=7936 RepID=A0A0E9WVC9_ANGAN